MIRRLMLLLWPVVLTAAGQFTRATDISVDGGGVALLVMVNGKIMHEDYRGSGGMERASELASGTKSFSGVLALCAVEDRLLRLDEKASATLTEWADDPKRRDITIRQLLTLTSGIPGRTLAHPLGTPPSYREAIKVPARWPPGDKYHYGTVPFQVFGEIMRRKLIGRNETVDGYLRKKILTPLNIKPAAWRRDDAGQPHLPSGAALTAREWARFGEMIRLDGQGVLPPGKLDALFHGTAANPGYGLTWWLPSQGAMGTFFKREVFTPGLPQDIWVAAGAGGQRLVVIPSLKLVAVRLAPVRLQEAGFDEKSWLAELVAECRRIGAVRETVQ